MDLFGFAKDIGRRLFNKDEDAAEKIKEHIEANNPGVENLEVKFESGIVELCGDCKDSAAQQKAILMAGNVKGVVDVYATKLNIPAPPPSDERQEQPAVEKVDFYIIERGDTLSKLAKKYYGNALDYPRIFEANREVIEDPDKIYPGQKIRIPLD